MLINHIHVCLNILSLVKNFRKFAYEVRTKASLDESVDENESRDNYCLHNITATLSKWGNKLTWTRPVTHWYEI